jgi:hypothetical protein
MTSRGTMSAFLPKVASRKFAGALLSGALAIFCLDLAPVASAQTSGALSGLLTKTRAQVEHFTDQFSYLRYDDDVVEAKLKNNDKVAYRQEIVYDSLLRMSFDEGKLRVDEQRLVAKPPRRVETRPLLETYGFSTLEMVFHPYYESSFRFSDSGSDLQQGRTLKKIAFQHIPNTPSPILYQTLGPDRPLDLSGVAWIDSSTGDIYRIDAVISSGINDIGIKSIDASVVFQPVVLQDEQTPELLPIRATIDLETPRQHWRNIHRFSDYRKYRVAVNMPGGSTQ